MRPRTMTLPTELSRTVAIHVLPSSSTRLWNGRTPSTVMATTGTPVFSP